MSPIKYKINWHITYIRCVPGKGWRRQKVSEVIRANQDKDLLLFCRFKLCSYMSIFFLSRFKYKYCTFKIRDSKKNEKTHASSELRAPWSHNVLRNPFQPAIVATVWSCPGMSPCTGATLLRWWSVKKPHLVPNLAQKSALCWTPCSCLAVNAPMWPRYLLTQVTVQTLN